MTFVRTPCPFPLGSVDFESPVFRSWLDGELRARDDLNLAARPLVLIGANSVLARPFVAWCRAHLNVVALVDNALPSDMAARPMVIGDGQFAEVLDLYPDAVGVLCCASEGALNHFTARWGERPQPLLFYLEVIAALPHAQAGPHLAFMAEFQSLATACAAWRTASKFLSDRDSLMVLDAVLLHHLTWDIGLLRPIRRPEKAIYFEPDVMPLSDDEVFIDGGAYDGDTVLQFARASDGNYREIHAFELDPANGTAFQAKAGAVPLTVLRSQGLWSHKDRLYLNHRDDMGSRIGDEGDKTVDLMALDDLDIAPTLIKLDIEGAEVPALRGAARTIAQHKPKLAICAYHKADDLMTLFETIHAIRDDYRFQLRHYSPVVFDTVIYAV